MGALLQVLTHDIAVTYYFNVHYCNSSPPPGFWSGLTADKLDYASILHIKKDNEKDAKDAFAAYEGLPSSDIFWASLHHGANNFKATGKTGFKVDWAETRYYYVRCSFHLQAL